MTYQEDEFCEDFDEYPEPDLITNFGKDVLHIYQRIASQFNIIHNRHLVYIDNQAYDIKGNLLPETYVLRWTEMSDKEDNSMSIFKMLDKDKKYQEYLDKLLHR